MDSDSLAGENVLIRRRAWLNRLTERNYMAVFPMASCYCGYCVMKSVYYLKTYNHCHFVFIFDLLTLMNKLVGMHPDGTWDRRIGKT